MLLFIVRHNENLPAEGWQQYINCGQWPTTGGPHTRYSLTQSIYQACAYYLVLERKKFHIQVTNLTSYLWRLGLSRHFLNGHILQISEHSISFS